MPRRSTIFMIFNNLLSCLVKKVYCMGKEEAKVMDSLEREIVYVGGERGTKGDFPVCTTYTQPDRWGGEAGATQVVDPILSESVFGNLYGRILTLVEATTDASRVKAVKNLYQKELNSWYSDVHTSAREVANHCDSSHNIYTRNSALPLD